jgi:hypothetical protein
MATSAVTTAAIPRPIYQNEHYTVADAILKFLAEKTKDVAKVLGYATFWWGQAQPGLPPEVKSFSVTMGEFKNFVSMTEVPQKTVAAIAAISALWANKTWKALGDAFSKSAEWTNAFVDGIDFGSRFVAIDTAVMTWLKGISFGATFGNSTKGAWENLQKMGRTAAAETTKTAFFTISFLRDMSYATLGAKGLFCIITATPMVPWIMVGLLTAGLTFTILGYFMERLYDPDNKSKNLNPDIVIANNLVRRRYEQLTGATTV